MHVLGFNGMVLVTTIMALMVGTMRVMVMPQEREQNERRSKRPKVREGNVTTEEFGVAYDVANQNARARQGN